MSYFSLTGFDGNVSPCTSILGACEAMFFQAYVLMDAITPFRVQTLIETLCNFLLDHADNRTFCYICLSWFTMSNFCLNISWVRFMFGDSGNHKASALWKKKRKQQTLSLQILARAFKV